MIYVSGWGHCTCRSAMTVLEGRVAREGSLACLPLLCSFGDMKVNRTVLAI